MKELAFLFVAVAAVIGFKVYAEDAAVRCEETPEVLIIDSTEDAKPVNPYLCMWSERDKDCVSGSNNYCICVDE